MMGLSSMLLMFTMMLGPSLVFGQGRIESRPAEGGWGNGAVSDYHPDQDPDARPTPHHSDHGGGNGGSRGAQMSPSNRSRRVRVWRSATASRASAPTVLHHHGSCPFRIACGKC